MSTTEVATKAAAHRPNLAGRAGSILLGLLLVVAGWQVYQTVLDQRADAAESSNQLESQKFMATIFLNFTNSGNVVLKFEDFKMQKWEARYFAYEAHALGCYLAFPNRLYAADEKTPVGLGWQEEPFPAFEPTGEWLKAHGVVATLSLRHDAAGRVSASVQNSSPVVPGNEMLSIRDDVRSAAQPPDYPWMGGYVLLILGSGLVLAALAGRGREFPVGGMVISLGIAAMGFILFFLSLAGAAPNRGALAGIGALVVLLLLWLARAGWLPRIRRPLPFGPQDAWGVPFCAVVLWAAWLVFCNDRDRPFLFLDAVGIWALKAKMLSLAALPALKSHFNEPVFTYSHPDYPLLLPFVTAGAYAANGGIDEAAGKFMLWVAYLGYAALLYSGCRALVSRPFAWALTALGAAAPMVIHWADKGTGDLFLAAFCAGAFSCALGWLRTKEAGWLWLAGLFSAAMIFTKNEGLPLAGIVLLACLLFGGRPDGRQLRLLLGMAAVAVALVGPWFVFRSGLPHLDEDYFERLRSSILAENVRHLPEIARGFFGTMFGDLRWATLWWLIMFLAAAGFARRPTRALFAAAFLLVAQLAAYILAYVVTLYPLEDLLDQTPNRLLMQALPAGVFLAAAALECLLSPAVPPAVCADDGQPVVSQLAPPAK